MNCGASPNRSRFNCSRCATRRAPKSLGGRRRQVAVQIDPERLAAHNVTALQVSQVLQGANVNMRSGSFTRDNREVLVESGSFLQSAKEIESLVVGVHAGRPVYVRDVAVVKDGPEEPTNYTRISFGPAAESPLGDASRAASRLIRQ